MKSFLPFVPVGLLVLACQPQAQQQAQQQPASTPAAAGIQLIENLPPDMRELLRNTDLTPLLRTTQDEGNEVLNGFFGADHYRIAFVVTDVRRDPARPTVYYLQGKDQYKGRVTPFAGTFTVRRFGEQPFYTAKQLAEAPKEWELSNKPGYYTTVGDFVLREDSTRRGAGVFQGQLALDWHRQTQPTLALECRNEQGSTQGGEIKYEGTWTNYRTRRVTPVVWVKDLMTYNNAKEVLADFNVGERGVEVNPKYAKLGWSSYWENDEWWADTKAPARPAAAATAEAADTAASLGI